MKYNHKKTEDGDFEIYREDKHVATYDPASEEVTFTSEENEKYSGPVGKQVQVLLDEETNPAPPAPPVVEEVKPKQTSDSPPEQTPEQIISSLRRQVKQLQVENVGLKDRIASDENKDEKNVPRLPSRYEDEFDDSEAPPKDPMLGDLTPSYIEWARENMPKEIFTKRYARRIKDL